MEYVKFGATEFKVSRLGLGCMSMSGAYGPADDNESIGKLQRAFDLRVDLFDFVRPVFAAVMLPFLVAHLIDRRFGSRLAPTGRRPARNGATAPPGATCCALAAA